MNIEPVCNEASGDEVTQDGGMRRVLRILLRSFLAVLLLLVVVYLLRGRLLAGPLARLVARQLGDDVTIERIEGTWFTNVVVIGFESPGLRFERAAAGYSLLGLLGDRPQDAIRSISVAGLDLDVDLTKPSEESDAPFRPFEFLPEKLPRLKLRGKVRLRTERGEVRSGVEVTGGGKFLDLILTNLKLPDLPDTPRFEVHIERDDSEFGGLRRIDPQADVHVWVRPYRRPGGYQISLDTDLSKLPFLSAKGTVGVRISTLDGESFTGSISAREVRFEGYRAEALDAQGEWKDGRATLGKLRAVEGDALIEARDISVEPEHPYFIASLASLDVEIPDLSAYLPGLDRKISVRAKVRGIEERHLIIEEMALEGEGSKVTLSGDVWLSEDPEEWWRTELDLSYEATLGDVHRLLAVLPTVEGTLSASGDLSGTLGALQGSLKAAGEQLVLEGRVVHTLQLTAKLQWPELKVENLRLEAEPGVVTAQAVIDLHKKSASEGAFFADIKELDEFLAMFPGAPAVEGKLQGRGTFQGDLTSIRGEGTLIGEELVYEGRKLGAVLVNATADAGAMRVERFEAKGEWGSAELRGSVDLKKRTGRIEVLKGSVERWSGKLRAPLEFSWTDETYAVHGLDLEALGGRVHGDLRFAELLVGSLQCEGLDLSAWGLEGALALKLVLGEKGALLEGLSFEGGEALSAEGGGLLPWRLGKGGLEFLEDADRSIRLDVRSTHVERFLGLAAAAAAVEIDGDRENLKVVLSLRDLALGKELPLAGETRIVLNSSAEGVVVNVTTPPASVAHIRGNLSFKRVVDWMRPEEIKAALNEAHIHGSLDVKVDDLGHFRRLVPAVLHLEGRLEADVRIAGYWKSPELDGEVRIDGVSCTLKGDIPPLHEGKGRILFEGRTIRIEGFECQLGYGPLAVRGTIHLPVEGAPEIDATLKGQNLLLARSRNLRLRSDVDLSVSGPLDALVAKGKLVVTDALYSQPMDLLAGSAPAADRKLQLFSIRNGPLSTLRLDIEIFGDRSFRISNNIVRGHFSPALRLRGTGAVPEPDGSIFFQDVLVKLELTSLKVDQGEVRFAPEDPFAPQVRIAAHTRMQGFDLDVALEGALPDVEIYVQTNPPLPPRDAIILLLTGNTPERLDQKGARGTLMLAGTVLGKRLLSKVQGPSDPDEESFLDRFNLDMGRDISLSGEETIETEFRVTEHWYARGERDRYDDYNFGLVWRLRFR